MVDLSPKKTEALKTRLQASIALLDKARAHLRHDENCASLEGSECDCSVKELSKEILDESIAVDDFLGSLEG